MKAPVVDYRKLRLSNITSDEYKHILLLGGWLFYLVMFFITENLIPESKCHIMHCVVDDWIPFNEYFIIFYVLWYFYLVLSIVYFFFYDTKSFAYMQKYIIIMQVVAVITFFVYPSVQYLRPEEFVNDNIFTRILGHIYAVDTPTGVFPSMHAGFSLAVASTWAKRKETSAVKKFIMCLIAFMICISVCFVKQHSFLDVVYALVIGVGAEFVVFYKDYWSIRFKKNKN